MTTSTAPRTPATTSSTDNAALSGNDIKDPQQETDQSGLPNVTFKFTDKGRKAFQEITRRIAQEGPGPRHRTGHCRAASQLSGNFAIVLDGGVVSRPIINFVENPDGIDGRTGAQISGGFDISGARNSPSSCSVVRCRSTSP